jgi:hypothetical protein
MAFGALRRHPRLADEATEVQPSHQGPARATAALSLAIALASLLMSILIVPVWEECGVLWLPSETDAGAPRSTTDPTTFCGSGAQTVGCASSPE